MKFTTNALIFSALKEGNYQVFSAIPHYFWNDIEQKYIESIKTFFKQYSTMPTIEYFMSMNPAFRKDELNVPLKLIFDKVSIQLQERWLEEQINGQFDAGHQVYNPDFLSQIAIKSKILPLDIVGYNEFDRNQYYKNISHVPTNIRWFDENFGGLLGGDLGFIFGRMKSGKTLTLQILQRAIYKNTNCKILAFSNELSTMQYIGKLDAMEGCFNPNVFRKLDFNEQIRVKIDQINKNARNRSSNIIVAGAVGNYEEVIATYLNLPEKPDLITIDGFELMGKFSGDAAQRSMSLGENAYGIKRFAIDYNIPVVATLQGNRNAVRGNEDAGAETVAGSDVFARACDWLIGARQIEENNQRYIRLYTAAYRHGEPAITHLKIDWETMNISFHDLLGNVNFEDDASPELEAIREFSDIKQQNKETV